MKFEEFLPGYLAAHSDRRTQLCHAAGTLSALTLLAASALMRKPVLVPIALVAGYAPAWFSHFVFEKNTPKTFGHPFWSLRGDFVMLARVLTGKTV